MSYTQIKVECPGYQSTGTTAYGTSTKTFAENLVSASGLVLKSVTTDTTSTYDANYEYPGYSNYYVRIFNLNATLRLYLMGINPINIATLTDISQSMEQLNSTYWEVIQSEDFCAFKGTYGASQEFIEFMTLTSELDGSRVKVCGKTFSYLWSDSLVSPQVSVGAAHFNVVSLGITSDQIRDMSANEYIA